MSNATTRRNFLRTGSFLAGGLALGLSPVSFGRILGSDERIRVGILGMGKWAQQALVPTLRSLSSSTNLEVFAFADIWERNRILGEQQFGLKSFSTPEALLEQKDLDAVLIATPDFQHGNQTLLALDAGKHVYLEPPLAPNLTEAQQIRDRVRAGRRVFQFGTFQRSAETLRQFGPELYRGLDLVEVLHFGQRGDGWRRIQETAHFQSAAFDWNAFFQASTGGDPVARLFTEFRNYPELSKGMVDHCLLPALDRFLFLTRLQDVSHISASSGLHQFHDGRQNPDALTAYLRFAVPEKEKGNPEIAFLFQGRLGLGAVSRENYHFSQGVQSFSGRQPEAGLALHLRNWIDSIRGEAKPISEVEGAYVLSEILDRVYRESQSYAASPVLA